MTGGPEHVHRGADPAVLTAAETIDRLTNLDFPRRGAIAALHAEAYRLAGGPLGLAAAREMLARTADSAVVAILTGFPEFPWIRRGVAETDGPVGAAVLARSLVKARRAIPIVPCEPHFAPGDRSGNARHRPHPDCRRRARPEVRTS